MARPSFGLEVQINPQVLTDLLGDPIAKAHGLNRTFLNKLDDGAWDALAYEKLFVIVSKAELLEIPAFLVQPKAIWSTFYEYKKSRLIIGHNREGSFVHEDWACASPFVKAFNPTSDPGKVYSRDEILAAMKEENVIAVGGSKVNEATRVALEVFQERSQKEIRFGWPNYDPQSFVEECSDDSRRYLRIGNKTFQEGHNGKAPLYGLIAACRKPLSKKNVTTVVLAGCSRTATEAIAREVQSPRFGREFHNKWAELAEGEPVFFVLSIDSKSRCTWHMIPPTQRPSRKKGRPKKGD